MHLLYMREVKDTSWDFASHCFALLFVVDAYSADAIEYIAVIFHPVIRIQEKKILPLTRDSRSVSVCNVLFAVK